MAKLRLLLKRSGKAFTFVELLIAMVIVAIVSGAVIMLGYTYFHHFEQSTELSMARERGIMVVTYLEKRILNAGLGMPKSADSFTGGFSGLWDATDLQPYTDSRDWDAPVYMPEIEEDDISSSDELMIAYTVPSGVFTTVSADISTTAATIDASGTKLDDNKVLTDNDENPKGWVVFPSALPLSVPLRITDYTNGTDNVEDLELSAKQATITVLPNDEMYLIRLIRVFVDNTSQQLKVDILDNTSSNNGQPVVEGILKCRFVYNDENKTLTVSVLSRGNRRYPKYVSPAEIIGWGHVEDNSWREYYLTAVKKGWRVRN
jgi:prepilin-type N-terminal cleavage/methylation domain-containing protein